jgi:DNA (cytosine-5)-methyltransferase 1
MPQPVMAKPPYRVPNMDEIRAIPWNGYTAISTFSGCGGSSTGYRMAGFRVLWASEFIDAARDSYAANKADYTVLDGRDIRLVKPEDILSATDLKVGDLDLLDGSPPCASFSTAGKREEHWGKAKKYSDKSQRTDDLFFEYARLLRGLQPKTFIAENVSGLIKGTAKGYFLSILKELKGCGYRVEAKLLDAQWLGVPQARQRLIFMGVRNDLELGPTFPKPLPYRYSVRDALPNIRRHGTAPPHAGQPQYCAGDITDRPSPPVTVGVNSVNSRHFQVEVEPEADISRFAIGDEWDKLKPGEQSERFFSLVKPHPDQPSPTVTAQAGTSSLASVTHPTEKRKFTIAELRRICGFPDDFILTGTYGQQWERLGRAVPPVMMAAIASAVRSSVLDKIAAGSEAPPRQTTPEESDQALAQT